MTTTDDYVAADTLSAQFDADRYHLRPKDTIRWSTVRGSTPCDECGALQYETRGRYRSRRPARHRRTIAGGPDLLLCHSHAAAWHARDDYDRTP